MSVGLIAVRLKYGLYVGHLSKWFVSVNSLCFSRLFLVVVSFLGLLVTLQERGLPDQYGGKLALTLPVL
jgi:hypothetical protein